MSTVVVYLTRYVTGPLTIGATVLSGTAVWALLAVKTGFVSPASLGGLGLSEGN